MPRSACALFLLCAAACGSPPAANDAAAADADGYREERVTEGTVTTVRHVSGSRWNGAAHFVKELSIGVLEGADEYMLGQITGAWLQGDEILIVDMQAPAVRAYDPQGTYLRTYGGSGQGPGEYERPMGVAALTDGRVVVLEAPQRINVYESDGEVLGSWTLASMPGVVGLDALLVTHDDRVYVPTMVLPEGAMPADLSEVRMGRQEVTLEGELGAVETTDLPDIQSCREGAPLRIDSSDLGPGPPVRCAAR